MAREHKKRDRDDESMQSATNVPIPTSNGFMEVMVVTAMGAISVQDLFTPNGQCVLCQKTVLSSSEKTLSMHLKTFHPEASGQLQGQRSVHQKLLPSGKTIVAPLVVKKEGVLRKIKETEVPTSNASQVPSLMEWMKDEKIPLHMISNVYFRSFISCLNPHFTFPSVQEITSCSTPTMLRVVPQRKSKWKLLVEKCPLPKARVQEALLKIHQTSLSCADIHLLTYERLSGRRLGSQFVATVSQVGDGTEDALVTKWQNQRVIAEPKIACGGCTACLRQQQCSAYKKKRPTNVLWVDYVVVPLSSLLLVPDSMPDPIAASLQPLAVAHALIATAKKAWGDQVPGKVALVGRSAVTHFTHHLLTEEYSHMTISIISLKEEEKEGKGTEKEQEEYSQRSEKGEKHQQIYESVLECSGSPQGWQKSIVIVQPMGTLITMEIAHDAKCKLDASMIVVKEIQWYGMGTPSLSKAMDTYTTIPETVWTELGIYDGTVLNTLANTRPWVSLPDLYRIQIRH